jgi:hypothetical protein
MLIECYKDSQNPFSIPSGIRLGDPGSDWGIRDQIGADPSPSFGTDPESSLVSPASRARMADIFDSRLCCIRAISIACLHSMYSAAYFPCLIFLGAVRVLEVQSRVCGAVPCCRDLGGHRMRWISRVSLAGFGSPPIGTWHGKGDDIRGRNCACEQVASNLADLENGM